jgi:hypothetical protein
MHCHAVKTYLALIQLANQTNTETSEAFCNSECQDVTGSNSFNIQKIEG